MVEKLKEIEKLYSDLGVEDRIYANNMPDNELKTDFPTKFRSFNITTTCLLTK